MLGTFCVEVIFINLKDMVETGKWVLNDARAPSYKDQISKPFGGYEKAKERGFFVEQTHPSYKNFLKYITERSSLKNQLNAAWNEIVEAGGEVKDRSFGSLDDMRRTLEGLLSTTSSKKSAITPSQSKNKRKRCFGEHLDNL